ncbi:MAG: hypothetical protein A2Z03_11925 [Chloroflexi bacterium RBG_16_56_8]|nr:MAG: hypothetical protein A2Z03_11925 [Chloroflexi bacterium RBG_16_56_8]OHD23840.1 MAG: hypothetical protein A2Y38_17270 [Spirochaetes bacterium GWB1_59_5]
MYKWKEDDVLSTAFNVLAFITILQFEQPHSMITQRLIVRLLSDNSQRIMLCDGRRFTEQDIVRALCELEEDGFIEQYATLIGAGKIEYRVVEETQT